MTNNSTSRLLDMFTFYNPLGTPQTLSGDGSKKYCLRNIIRRVNEFLELIDYYYEKALEKDHINKLYREFAPILKNISIFQMWQNQLDNTIKLDEDLEYFNEIKCRIEKRDSTFGANLFLFEGNDKLIQTRDSATRGCFEWEKRESN